MLANAEAFSMNVIVRIATKNKDIFEKEIQIPIVPRKGTALRLKIGDTEHKLIVERLSVKDCDWDKPGNKAIVWIDGSNMTESRYPIKDQPNFYFENDPTWRRATGEDLCVDGEACWQVAKGMKVRVVIKLKDTAAFLKEMTITGIPPLAGSEMEIYIGTKYRKLKVSEIEWNETENVMFVRTTSDNLTYFLYGLNYLLEGDISWTRTW